MEDLLSQLQEAVIESGLNKEDPCLLHSIDREGMSVGVSSEKSMKQRCVLPLKQ
jgi:hypothetical protein